MPIRIDWGEIKSKLGDVTAIYALTHRQASLILSAIERLEWRATYRDFGYDYADWDILQQDVADLHHNLTMPVNLVDIIQYIDEVEDLLRSLQTLGVCCEDIRPISEVYRTPLTDDFPSTPPATWGNNEPVADADDWRDLVCGAANSYVDLLKETNNELDRIITAAALGVGAIAGLLTLLSGAGIILAIGYGTAATIVGGLVAGASIGTFTGVDEDLESGRDDIVCAILNGDHTDLSDAIEGYVSALAWNLWFRWIDYENAYNVMISGTNGSEFLRVERGSGNCECAEIGDYQVLFTLDSREGWVQWTETSVHGNPIPSLRQDYDNATPLSLSVNNLRTKAGLSNPAGAWVDIHKLRFDYRSHNATTAPGIVARVLGGGSIQWTEAFAKTDVWTTIERTFTPPIREYLTFNVLQFVRNTGGTAFYCYVDNIYVDFDAST